MMNNIPKDIIYAWYILKYNEEFYGKLTDEECIRKIANETGSVNLLYYTLRKKELVEFSEDEMSTAKEIFKDYDLPI